jgi:hypothetical protein
VVSERLFTLPAVILAGWALSWWGPRKVRWGLLSAATVVSALCVLIGVRTNGPPATPQGTDCSSALACVDPSSVYWLVTGLLGFACCVVLTTVTLLVGVVSREDAGPPRSHAEP